MDEFCSGIGYPGQRFHIDSWKDPGVPDQGWVGAEDSRHVGNEHDLVCFECHCQQESRRVASSSAESANASVRCSTDESSYHGDHSIAEDWLEVASDALDASSLERVRVQEIIVGDYGPVSVRWVVASCLYSSRFQRSRKYSRASPLTHRQNIVSICIDQSGTSVREMQQAIGSVTCSANNYHDKVSARILPHSRCY